MHCLSRLPLLWSPSLFTANGMHYILSCCIPCVTTCVNCIVYNCNWVELFTYFNGIFIFLLTPIYRDVKHSISYIITMRRILFIRNLKFYSSHSHSKFDQKHISYFRRPPSWIDVKLAVVVSSFIKALILIIF